jgi:hypothetical protein
MQRMESNQFPKYKLENVKWVGLDGGHMKFIK